MKKQITVLLAILFIIATSCTKDITEKECVKKDLKTTLVGEWKLTHNGTILSFNDDMTFEDKSNSLSECASGKWKTLGETKFELSCPGRFIDIRLSSFTCDTVVLILPNYGNTPMIRR